MNASTKRSCLTSVLLVLLLACVGVVVFSFAASPASAAIFASPTATKENQWAYMDLPKPAYTATPVPVLPPTEIPIPTSTTVVADAPAQLSMEMVDTSSAALTSTQSQAPVPSYGGSKLILVDISEQHMYVYDGDTLVYSFVASTGMHNATKVGTFAVQSKIPNAYGSTWDIWMPDWLGIYYAGGLENGIHALPILPNGATLWAGYLGTPISYGCVVLDTYDAQLLYNWAEIGTPVKIQW
jgi:lipoprotein-anchoring transpeptidase ErfK/SrfK